MFLISLDQKLVIKFLWPYRKCMASQVVGERKCYKSQVVFLRYGLVVNCSQRKQRCLVTNCTQRNQSQDHFTVAVVVIKYGCVVGHYPRTISQTVSIFLGKYARE